MPIIHTLPADGPVAEVVYTQSLKIFARGWIAQEPIFYTVNAKIFQGLGPKRRESCDGDRVYTSNLPTNIAGVKL